MPASPSLCPHFGICGGCSTQDRPYSEQLTAKEAAVRAALAGLEVETWHSIRPSPDLFYYRNKMEFSFGDLRDVEILSTPRPEKGRRVSPVLTVPNIVHLGLHPKGRFAVVTPTPDCRLLSVEAQRVLEEVVRWATERQVSVYTRKNAQGDLRHLVIREGKNTDERMVNLIGKSTTPFVSELAERLKQSGLPITTFLFSAYDGLSDVAGADCREIFWGEGFFQERVGRVTFRVTPSTFMQSNTRAAEGMIELLSSWLEEKTARLVDLYCGTGAIGLNLATRAAEVVGIEINPVAVEDARVTAAANGITNARFIAGRAEAEAPALGLEAVGENDIVVVDPPRAGLHPTVIETLLVWKFPSIFYVSCNPLTLGRDLRLLGATYRILDVQPMDFFPHTDHIETAVRLVRR